MSEAKWYVARDGTALGPFTLAELRQMTTGTLNREDLVCAEGREDWTTAATVPGLFSSPPPLPAASDTAPAPDRRAFTLLLLGQTLANWFGAGFLLGLAVDLSGIGVPLVLGLIAAACGAATAGGLAFTSMADRWLLLRWVNHVLNRAAVVGPFAGFVVVRLFLGVFERLLFPEGAMPAARAQELWYLTLRASFVFGLLAGLVVYLVRTWPLVRHVDLPTDLKGRN
jgi:hypothetical protein